MTLPVLDQPTPCAGLWSLFDSRDRADHLRAKALCDQCPIALACWQHLQDVRNSPADIGGSPEGTWAGQLFNEARMPGRPREEVA